jgi:hypothetical protein
VSSPLGKYAPLVASIAAIGVIGAYLVGVLLGNGDATNLKDFALIALGAVFGSATSSYVTTNGLKGDVAALHQRMDSAGVPAAAATDGSR